MKTRLPVAALLFLAAPAFAQATAPASVKQLQQDRLAAAKDLLAAATEQLNDNKSTVHDVLSAAQKVYESQLEIATTDTQRLQAAQEYVKTLEEQSDTIRQRSLGGLATPADVAAAKYQLTCAQIAVAKLQTKP